MEVFGAAAEGALEGRADGHFSSGLILDLSPPIAVLDPMRLSATGALQIGPVSVPPRVTTGMTIWFQGLAYSMQGSVSESLSNGVMVVVQ